MKRITRDNISEELLKEAAVRHGGYLGGYKKEEFDALTTFETPNWKFVWTPFKMDENTGKVTIVGRSREAVRQLDIGRSRGLMRRYPKMSRFHALRMILALKRRRFGLLPMVQDFLITNALNPELQALAKPETLDELKTWLKQHGYGHFREELVQQLPVLVEKAAGVLYTPVPPRKPRGDRKPQGKGKSRGQVKVVANVDEASIQAQA